MLYVMWFFRDWQFYYRTFILIIFMQAMGILSWVLIENVQLQTKEELLRKSSALIGGQVQVLTRGDFKANEKEVLDKYFSQYLTNKIVETYSLVEFSPEASLKLSEIQASLSFSHEDKKIVLRPGEVIIHQDFKNWFDLKIGDKIKVGKIQLNISDILESDEQQSLRGFSLAKRIRIHPDDLSKTGLIVQEGSLTSTAIIFEVEEKEIPLLVNQLKEKLNDPRIKIKTNQDSEDILGRTQKIIVDFLRLISLLSFSLSLMGLTYLWRSYWSKRLKDVLTQTFLGLSKNKALFFMLCQILFISLISLTLLFFIGEVVLHELSIKLNSWFDLNLNLTMKLRSLILGGIPLVVFLMMAIYPYLRKILSLNLRMEFSESLLEPDKKSIWLARLVFSVFLIWFIFLTIPSWKFILGFLIFISLIFILTIGLIKFLKIIIEPSFELWKEFDSGFILRQIIRRSAQSFLTNFSLIFVSSLLIFLVMLSQGLKNDLSFTQDKPTLFLFDIQEDQVSSLTQLVSESLDSKILNLSPMVRGRLLKINQQAISRTETESFSFREQEDSARFRERGVNITYSDTVNQAELIVQGVNILGPDVEGVIPISLEERYAQRIGVKLNDILEFEVLGVSFITKVRQIRKIKWTSFLPNFFIKFPAGFLEDAPQTYLAALKLASPQQIQDFQKGLLNQMPNISSLNLEELTQRIGTLLGFAQNLIGFMMGICLLIGFLVLYSMLQEQYWNRQEEFKLLLKLGATKNKLMTQFSREWSFHTLLSFSFGPILGLLLAQIVGNTMFSLSGIWNIKHFLQYWLFLNMSFIGLVWLFSWLNFKFRLRL